MQTLDIAVIRTDGGTQPRAQIDMATVAEYAEDMAREAAFPPVVVFFDGECYWLADGFHRYHAALSLRLATLDADVRRGTLQEAQWYSYSVNQSHGLRRTNEDKRRAVEAALGHPFAARNSNYQIARHCGVSEFMVRQYRESIYDNIADTPRIVTGTPLQRLVTRNGTTYPMDVTDIGRRGTDADGTLVRGEAGNYRKNGDLKRCEKCGSLWMADLPYCPYCHVSPEARAAYVQHEQEKPQLPHVSYNSGNNEWYTPEQYITAARAVMGEIDLDPASSEVANAVIGADAFYTADDDGLSKDWYGSVWMNPPYASELVGKFCTKLANHVSDGDVAQAIVLVNNATETTWFNTLIAVASAVCFPRGRVRFWSPERESATPLQGQAIIYIGPNVEVFRAEFSHIGWSAVL